MLIRFIATLGMANLALIAPLAASAQDVPSYAQGDAPQYAQQGPPSYATQDQQIHGRVISFDGGFSLEVRDDQGYVDNVQLHQGTVINPTGLTLASGMVVSINGYSQGNEFAANEIDTPYTFYNAVPYYSGYPWYHYDEGVSIGFFFGNNGWWHGDYYGRPAYFVGGCRTYNVGLYFGGGDYGGYWHGRDYVAPYNNGGYVPPVSRGGWRSTQGYAPAQGGNRGPVNGGGYRSTQGYTPQQGGNYRTPVNGGGYRSPQGYTPQQGGNYHTPVNGGGYRSPQGYTAQQGGNYHTPVNGGGYRSPQGYAPQGGNYHAPANGGGYRSPQGYAPQGGRGEASGSSRAVAPRGPVTREASHGDDRHH